MVTPQSGGGRKAAADEPTTTLPDPGLPDGDLKQLGYQLFKACGLTYLTWAPLPLDDVIGAVLTKIPGLGHTTVNAVGGGTQGSQDNPDGMWMAYEGPHGSVLAYHVMQSNDFALEAAMQLPEIVDPVQWGIATVGATVPAGVAQIITGGRAVPLWELTAFANQRPTGAGRPVPPTLASGLLTHGWSQLDDGSGFRLDVPLVRGGTQAVFFTPYDGRSFAVLAPLDSSVDGAIPEPLRGRVFGNYSLEVVADTIVLCERFPAEPIEPDAEAVTAAGRAITLYAEQQFADPATAPEGQSAVPVPPVPPFAPTVEVTAAVAGPTRSMPFQAELPVAAPPPAYYAPTYPTPTPMPPNVAPPGGITPRHVAMLAAAVVAIVVVVIVATSFGGGSRDSDTSNAGGSGSSRENRTNAGSDCSDAPALTPQSIGFDSGGLNVTTLISTGCDDDVTLSNSRFRVTAVDSSGRNVAAGVFDMAATPITVDPGGTTATFTFPAGSYWRTGDAIAGELVLTGHPEGTDAAVRNGFSSATALRASHTGTPESGSMEAAAHSALLDIVASDRPFIDANLLHRWQPQLSSKYPGLHADGITWTASDIVREHMELRQRFPQARLVWSPDWSVYRSNPQWWITLSGLPFGSAEAANDWCASQGFDADHCYAKMLSHTMGTDGTSKYR